MLKEFIIFLSMLTLIVCNYSNEPSICQQISTKQKPVFDYAFTQRTNISKHYLICNGHKWQIVNVSEESFGIETGVTDSERLEEILGFSIRNGSQDYKLTCFYKPTWEKLFSCKMEYKTNPSDTLPAKLSFQTKFNVNSRCRLNVESTVTYIPHSYTLNSDTSNSVLFVDKTSRNVWTSRWILLEKRYPPSCFKANDNTEYIPKFLYAIDHSLEITGIFGVSVSKALVLFYHNGIHKFCVTHEHQLSDDCKPENLKTYLNDCYNGRDFPTLGSTASTATITTKTLTTSTRSTFPTKASTITTTSKSAVTHVVSNTTDALPSNKPSKWKSIWIVMAIIAVVLIIIGICVCALIYCVYRSNNKSQTGETNDRNDKQISDSTHTSQPQQQSESSEQKK